MGDARCLTAHVLTNCVSRDASAAGPDVPTMMQESAGALGPWPAPHFRTVFVLVLRETVLVLILEAAAGIRVRVPSCGLSTSTKVAETNFRRKSWVTPGALRPLACPTFLHRFRTRTQRNGTRTRTRSRRRDSSTSTILRIEYEYESRGNQLQAEIVGDARCLTAHGLKQSPVPNTSFTLHCRVPVSPSPFFHPRFFCDQKSLDNRDNPD